MSISKDLSTLKELKSLNLKRNPHLNFEQIFGFLVNLPSLEALDLSYNYINKLTESFYKLSKVKSLNLEGNNIYVIDEGVKNLQNLRSLDLSYNRDLDLKISLENLSNCHLKNLRICYLPEQNLCEEIGLLKDLEHLDMAGIL